MVKVKLSSGTESIPIEALSTEYEFEARDVNSLSVGIESRMDIMGKESYKDPDKASAG